MTKNVIETFNLTKVYKLKGSNKLIKALNNVNISVKKNEIFGLLGPNGAGKTTMVKILTTVIQPTSGYALIDGVNILKKPFQAKSNIALMLGVWMLYYRMTGYDNLKFFCKMYEVKNYKEKIEHIAKEFGLENWLNQYVENYSSGMRMKLALCRTLLLERNILFLDEPTFGLDIQTKSFVANKLKEVNNTIFLTSHDIGIIEKLCDRIAFIDKGEILKIGSKEDIKKMEHTEIRIEIEVSQNINKLTSELNQQSFVNEIIETKNGFIVSIKERDNYNDILAILRNYRVLKIKEQDFNLEDLFFRLI